MRLVVPAPLPLCRALWAAFAVAILLPGCGGTAPTAPIAPAASRNVVRPVPVAAAAAPTAAGSPWANLQTQVGNYPVGGADFLRAGQLAERLQGLLGLATYNRLLDNLQVSGPLRQEGSMLYVTGNRPHEGGMEVAAVVIHPATDTVRVWLLTEGEEWDVRDQGAPKTLPAAVATMMENARR